MDMLVVFGRGIEQAKTARGYVWKPTRYVEKLNEQYQHSCFRTNDVSLDDADDRIVIAGANANVIAAAHLLHKWRMEGQAPKLVTFAAGRPGYIANNPDLTLTEGRVLKERFLRLVRDVSDIEITIQDKNKNTRDDLLESLRIAQSRGLTSIGIVTPHNHQPRTKEFFRFALLEDPTLQSIHTEFYASELVLSERSRRYLNLLYPIAFTRAYKRTVEMEERGITALRSGKYNFGSQGFAFAQNQK